MTLHAGLAASASCIGVEGDEATRVRLAARASTPPLLLHHLAQDPCPLVRAAVAMNPSIAPDANRRLLADEDERVRILLAGKLATLLPGLTRAGQDAAMDHVSLMLAALAEDVAARVRIAMAHALTTLPEAPRAVLLRLAQDPVHLVSDPVLRLCPLLTDADLLTLLATPPHDHAMHSVAARSNLGPDVADHIAAHAHHDAVRVLLQNHSATIREATLDALVGRAPDHPGWHEPLVRRPTLPPRALRTLLSLVADDLRAILATHKDVPPDLAPSLAQELAQALGDTLQQPAAMPAPTSEHALTAAIAAGDIAQAVETLAEQAGIPAPWVERAIAVRSSKGITSLAWKAGLPPATAQALLAMLELPAGPSSCADRFPFTPTEMAWQVELLARPHAGVS